MKWLLWGLAVIVLFGACNGFGKGEKNYVKNYGSGIASGKDDSTTVRWESTFYDLGVRKRGTDIDVEYTFENTGDKPFLIDSIYGTCGCTLFDFPRKPVAPGRSGSVTIRYVSSEQPLAIMQRSIYLKTNTKGHPFHTLAFNIELTEK
ncbi:MAG: DUF1573 domain-containing protein [Sphingobacteriales bacterium]|nr:DUF1573 domain-containing protein [Sphingobacteriales bacterium]